MFAGNHVRSRNVYRLSIRAVLVMMILCLFPYFAAAQGIPNIQWLNSPLLSVNQVAYSPDGKTIAVGGAGPDFAIINLYSASTHMLLYSLYTLGPQSSIHCLAFSPDGKTLADGGNYRVLQIWSVSTGKLLRAFNTAAGTEVASVVFSPDGKTLADGGYAYNSNGYYGVVELWNVATGIRIRSFNTTATNVAALAFSPDGTTLAVGGTYHYGFNVSFGIVELWNLSTGKLVTSLGTLEPSVASVAFSPDGKTLIDGGAGYSGALELWNVATSQRVTFYNPLTTGLSSVAWDPTSQFIGYGASDGLLMMVANPLYIPPTLQSLTLAGSSVTGGKSLTGTVTLTAPAPIQGGYVVLKSSDTTVATVPAFVVIGSAGTSAPFTLQTKKVTSSKTVTITATYGGKTATLTLTVTP